jgi:hypothetical protein
VRQAGERAFVNKLFDSEVPNDIFRLSASKRYYRRERERAQGRRVEMNFSASAAISAAKIKAFHSLAGTAGS